MKKVYENGLERQRRFHLPFCICFTASVSRLRRETLLKRENVEAVCVLVPDIIHHAAHDVDAKTANRTLIRIKRDISFGLFSRIILHAVVLEGNEDSVLFCRACDLDDIRSAVKDDV